MDSSGYGYGATDRRPKNYIRQIQALGFAVTITKPRNPTPPLTRPDHRAWSGSAAARPIPAGYFPVNSHTVSEDIIVRLRLMCDTVASLDAGQR